MKKNRVDELMATMRSFPKKRYQKEELLPEMFALQQEIVGLAFERENASLADLRIWDVERHLEQMNSDCGNVADIELMRFKEGSKILCNLIKAEVSGNRGEAKAFRTLQHIRTRNIILKNVELRDEDRRTELDAVVVTPGCITIIEVKNTAKNIFIDENGDYYRTGEFLKWDCNIGNKMAFKEELIRRILTKNGIENDLIKSVVVFTDNRIEVQNKYPRIKTCFVSQLAYIIDDFNETGRKTVYELSHIENAIKEAECKEAYPFDFDVMQYKKDFASVMALLEEAKAKVEKEEYKKDEKNERKGVWSMVKAFFTSSTGFIGSKAAAVVVTFISTVFASTIRKGGF